MKRLFDVLAKILDVDPSTLNDESGPENIESWDSFNGLLIADELEKEFKCKFGMEEVMDVKNIADIKRHLRNHGVDVDG